MPVAVNARAMEFGFGKQTAEGSPLANPAFATPVFDGLPSPVQTVDPIDVTDTANAMPIVWKTDLHWEANVTIPGFPDSLGVLLESLMPSDAVTGAGDPYTHTFTPTGTDPFLTMWARRHTLYETFSDGMVSEITINFNETDPIQVGVVATGKNIPTVGTSAYTAGTTNTMATTSEFFVPVGATLKLDEAATPSTTTKTNITSGAISIRRQTDLLGAAETVGPYYIFRGTYEVGVTLDMVWADWSAYRASFYGSTTGTAASNTIVNGSVDFKFLSNGNSAHSLQIQVPQVALLAESPAPDAGGGPLRVSIDGMATRPASGSVVTAILKNALSADYDA